MAPSLEDLVRNMFCEQRQLMMQPGAERAKSSDVTKLNPDVTLRERWGNMHICAKPYDRANILGRMQTIPRADSGTGARKLSVKRLGNA